MGATRPASGKYATFIWQSPYFLPFSIPTRDASPPLEVALGGSVSGNLKCPKTISFLMPFLNTLPVHCYVAPQPCNAKKYIFALYCARLALTLPPQTKLVHTYIVL